MSPSRTGLAAVVGVAGLVFWRNSSDDTKQSIFTFLSQIPAAMEEAERRRAFAERQSQIPVGMPELFPVLLDDQSISEILAELNGNQIRAMIERPVPKMKSDPVSAEFSPDPEILWHQLVPHPSAVLILGKRGSGKSALAHRLLELFRFRADAYAVGLPEKAADLLPKWIGTVDSLKDLPLGSTAVVDEAHLRYNSRDGHSNDSRSISEALNLCRQRGQTIIVISQEARQIDKNIASSADVIIFKEPAMLQVKFERRELRSIAEKAVSGFQSIKGSKQAWSYVYSSGTDFAGMLENRLPSFWGDDLSRVFATGTVPAAHRLAPKVTIEEKRERANELKAAGHSYGEIARTLGVSKATAVNYVKGYPYH